VKLNENKTFFSGQTFPDFAPWLTYRPPLPLPGYLPGAKIILKTFFYLSLMFRENKLECL
jgi:hypothetical protein